jgi:NlpE-like protein
MVRLLDFVLPLCFLVSACGSTGSKSSGVSNHDAIRRERVPFSVKGSPITYTGILPCPDCDGVRYTLSLREDFVYFLRMTYAEDGPHSNFDQIGVWTLSADKTALILRSGREASLIFAFTAAGNLRKITKGTSRLRRGSIMT